MNRKETTASLAIVSIALLATIMITTPTQALAIDYGSPDLSYLPKGGFAEDGTNNSGNSDNTNGDSGDREQEDSTTAQLQARTKDQKIVQTTKKIHLV